MKKIRILMIFALFALGCFALVACGETTVPDYTNPSSGAYYNYNIDTGEFDNDDRLTVDGDKVKMYLAFDEKTTLTPTGTITFDGDDFSAEASTKYMGMKVECLFGGFTLNDALVLTYQEMKVDGESAGRSTDMEYYCRKGKVDLSRTVTLDFAGGSFDGQSFTTLKTDKYGRISGEIPKPERDKYDFVNYKRPSGGYIDLRTSQIDRDVTLTADWKRYYLVKYDVGSTDAAIAESDSVRKLSPFYDGQKMDIPAPPKFEYTGDPATPFRGWFVNGEPYTPFMETTDDVTVKGEWYDKSTVDSYNASLSAYGSNCLVVHVKPSFHS